MYSRKCAIPLFPAFSSRAPAFIHTPIEAERTVGIVSVTMRIPFSNTVFRYAESSCRSERSVCCWESLFKDYPKFLRENIRLWREGNNWKKLSPKVENILLFIKKCANIINTISIISLHHRHFPSFCNIACFQFVKIFSAG